MVEDDPTLLTRLTPRDYEARAERAIVVRVSAWDAYCPQHIPRLFSEAELAAMLAEKDVRIAELEALLRHPSPDLASTIQATSSPRPR